MSINEDPEISPSLTFESRQAKPAASLTEARKEPTETEPRPGGPPKRPPGVVSDAQLAAARRVVSKAFDFHPEEEDPTEAPQEHETPPEQAAAHAEAPEGASAPAIQEPPLQRTRGLPRRTLLLSFALLLVGLSYFAYRAISKWQQQQQQLERAERESEKEWAVDMVKKSALGTQSLMLSVARQVLDENVALGDCDWIVDPMWNGSFQNPNWFTQSKGITAYQVICLAAVEGGDDQQPDIIRFSWVVSADGWGVKSFQWDWYDE